MKHFIYFIFIFIALLSCSQDEVKTLQDGPKSEISDGYLPSLNETIELVLEEDHKGWLNEYKKDVIGEIRGSWAQNYNSWKNFNLTERIIIKYEDLISDPFNTFSNVIEYLNKLTGIDINEKKIKKCIEITDFNKLKNLERKSGFKENYNKKEPFFNKGKSNQWRNILDKKIISKIEEKFNREMQELKYI